MEISELVEAVVRGERWAGPALVSVLCPVLLGYAATIGGDLSEADREQAVERAVLRGVDRIDKYDQDRASFTTWLRPFVRHALGDIRRAKSEAPATHPRASEAEPDALEDAVLKPEVEELTYVLLQLPLSDQLIIQLRDFEGLSYAQIAERIGGVTEGACRVRHHRALARLRELLRDHPAFSRYQEGSKE